MTDPNPHLPRMIPSPPAANQRGFWPSKTRHVYRVPNRVHKLVQEGRIKQVCADPDGLQQPYDHPRVFYFDVSGALRVVYAEWPKDGRRKLNQLSDAVGEFWRWQQCHSIEEIYLTLVMLDI